MSNDILLSAELLVIEAELKRNQADIDFTEAVLARGGSEADGMRERLARLEAERGDLLEALDARRSQN